MKIKVLKLFTANLSKQKTFYTKALGLSILEEDTTKVVFRLGNSLLEFIQNEKFTPYHFALNIPCNQEQEALSWLKERVTILKDGNNEIQNFESWNAKAIYFYDADYNIVEFIARNTLNNKSAQEFTSNSILEISEIGIPVSDVAKTYNSLSKYVKLPIYSGNLDRFCAIGNEHGLFICINKSSKNWFPTGDKAYASPFEIEFEEQKNSFHFIFKNENLMDI